MPKIGGLVIQSLAKLVTSLPKEPFMKWGLDFVSQLNQHVDIHEINTFL
jgi:hypothetical protein